MQVTSMEYTGWDNKKTFGGSQTLTSISDCGEMRDCNVNIKPESHLWHTHTHKTKQNKTKYPIFLYFADRASQYIYLNPLNTELNPICQ